MKMHFNRPLFLFTLLAFSLAPLSQALAYTAAFDQKVSVQGQSVADFKVSVKDKNVRAESKFGNLTAIMIRNSEGAFSYLPEQKRATKIPDEMVQRNVADDLPDFEAFLTERKAEKTGAETVDGKQADIYTFKDPVSNETSRVWYWVEKKFPLKIEIDSAQGLTAIEFLNIQLEPALDDSLFKLPADVQLVSLPAAPAEGAAPEAPAAPAAPEAEQPAA